jgi:peptidyl-prolyl cis-trans isomerase B (cyclophilin B)
MKKAMVCILSLLALTFAGCVEDEEPGNRTGVICTNLGPLTIELYGEQAPRTVANFINLAESGYYDGLVFHRIITDFMMQGGDPTGTGGGGEAYGGGMLDDEIHPDLRHDQAGILSMAKTSAPNTASSQFFILFDHETSASQPPGTPWLDDKHSVFGLVTDGLPLLDEIEAAAASSSGTPQADVFMQTVLIDGTAADCPSAAGIPEPEPANVSGDVITAGVWDVTNQADSILAFAINTGEASSDVTFGFTAAGSAPLPDGWTLDIEQPTGTVAGDGEVHTLLHLSVPAGTSGAYAMELHTGASITPVMVNVALDGQRISARGDSVNVQYRGTCTDGGKEFDSGEFPLTLGGGKAIPGFDVGLIGLHQGEPAILVLPAQIGYGSSGGPCAAQAHAGMSFEVEVLSFEA